MGEPGGPLSASTPTPTMPASRIIRAVSARIRARFSAACSLETLIDPSSAATILDMVW